MDGRSSLIRNLSVVLVAIASFLSACALLLWLVGFFDFSGSSEDEAKIIAATVALLGVLASSTVAVLGTMFKQSFDERSLALQREAEDRFRTDTALKAVDLMATEDGKELESNMQREASLIALATLGHHDLALNLVGQLWPSNLVSTRCAMTAIDSALRSSQERVQRHAAEVLGEYIPGLVTEDGAYSFPDIVYLKWDESLPASAKYDILDTLLQCMLSKPVEFWKSSVRNQFLYSLFKIMGDSSDTTVSVGAALCAKELVQQCSGGDLTAGFCPPDRQSIKYSEILERAESIAPTLEACFERTTNTMYEYSVQLLSWRLVSPFEVRAQDDLGTFFNHEN